MQDRNKFLKTRGNNSGESLLFVIVIMMLLLVIGTSLLVAAGANAGTSLKQREHSQIMILDDSVHKNIMYSLQYDATSPSLLSAQLAMIIYKANDSASPYTSASLAAGIPLDIEITDGGGSDIELGNDSIKVESITLSFPVQNVFIAPPVPAVYIYKENAADPDNPILERDKPRQPKTATVDATMIVTVVISANGKLSTTRAVYQYTGGYLSDDPTGIHYDNDTPGAAFDMFFTSEGYGKWRLIKHENVDSKN